LAETMGWAMSTDSFPAQEEVSVRAKQAVIDRPDLSSLSDAELVGRAREMTQLIYDAWVPYCQSALGASLGPGAVQAICGAIGRGDDAVRLMAAIGDVESAEASFRMWDMSRRVQGSPSLMAAFDAGVDDLLDRLSAASNDDATGFLSDWDSLIAEHGHRGPNEWDMGIRPLPSA